MSDLILYADPSYARMVSKILKKYPTKFHGTQEGLRAMYIVERQVLQQVIPTAIYDGKDTARLLLNVTERHMQESMADAIVDILHELGYNAERGKMYTVEREWESGIFFKKQKHSTSFYIDIDIWWDDE